MPGASVVEPSIELVGLAARQASTTATRECIGRVTVDVFCPAVLVQIFEEKPRRLSAYASQWEREQSPTRRSRSLN